MTSIAPDQAAVFTAASQRVTRAFLLAQVAEAERFGIGDCLWATQIRDCVERIESHLTVPAGFRRAGERPALRLVGTEPGGQPDLEQDL